MNDGSLHVAAQHLDRLLTLLWRPALALPLAEFKRRRSCSCAVRRKHNGPDIYEAGHGALFAERRHMGKNKGNAVSPQVQRNNMRVIGPT